MIPALLLGRKGSVGFPGKNIYPVLGRPISWYVMEAAKQARSVDRVYLSTDCPDLTALAMENGVEVIDRPLELGTKTALGEDAFVHGFEEIKKRNPDQDIEQIVLLFCNAPTFVPSQIDQGVALLREKSEIDSVVTAYRQNWYSPARARLLDDNGNLQPFIPFENFPISTINCDRDAQGDCYFVDVCVSVIRPENLENIGGGMLPQKWMGQKIHPIENVGGLDIDEEWQLPLIEGYLLRAGFTDTKTPYK